MNFSRDEQFPESILNNSIENISCKELLSPKFIPRTRGLKLNFDLSENCEIISNSVDQPFNDVYFKDGEEINEINNDCHNSKLLTRQILPTSEQLETLDKLDQKNNTNVDKKELMFFCANNNLSQNKFNDQTNYLINQVICSSPLLSSLHKLKVDDVEDISKNDDTSPEKIISSHFIIDNKNNEKIETYVSMNESSIDQNNSWTDNSSFKFHWWKVPLVKFYGFSCWLSNKIFKVIKTNYQKCYRFFGTVVTEPVPIEKTQKSSDDLTQIASIIKAENERMLLLFSEKINSIKQELSQVHTLNKNTLSELKCELDIVKNTSNKLAQNNDELTREFTMLSRKLNETIQINSANSLRISGSILISEPPPPPPPPPLPPIHHSIPITPKSQNPNLTPKQKFSTPLPDGRPLITVEDLRKVTLKKAPQKNKENNPKYNMETPRGPAISLDMLRSVKLKSARRSRSNADTKNVRSPRRALKSCETQNFSFSPIMAGAVSPLSRILKQVDNRRKRSLMSPTYSDNDLKQDSAKKFDVMQQSKSPHMIFV
ncbi:hypothetical protein PV327_004886 [Microctonus hyperodae]|uniref:Uncharacterized protein n=1 Tax=Microctonus hyperodae TaxID=165561 RepID=A0AA39FDD4_MICHY|nr:hypothetical protein PV327_004886 [Microctonus hyperodae]